MYNLQLRTFFLNYLRLQLYFLFNKLCFSNNPKQVTCKKNSPKNQCYHSKNKIL